MLRLSSRDTCIWLIPILIGDLGLGQSLDEAEGQDQALAFGELGQVRGEGRPVLGV